ncbi:MAG: Lar family restriction alleviation protein [Paracoccaceae bacterium]|nr:Lar family restriction alleviation protein [Paracoccaceae bacterium]
MAEELKPCPFCGMSADIITEQEDFYPTRVKIVCSECGASTKYVKGTHRTGMLTINDDEKAIAFWNTRKEQ